MIEYLKILASVVFGVSPLFLGGLHVATSIEIYGRQFYVEIRLLIADCHFKNAFIAI